MRSAGYRPLARLTRRREFLRAARARTIATPGLVVQARRRGEDEPDGDLVRVGFTASKKVGNAVRRNRARRRLRAVAQDVLNQHGQPGFDYVLVARATTPERPYDALLADLSGALDRLARGGGSERPPRDKRRRGKPGRPEGRA